MNQPPLQNPDLQNDRVEKSRTVDGCPENNIQGNENRAIQGSDNLAVQGDGNRVSQNSNNLNGSGSHFIKNMQADKVVFINGIYSEVCIEEKLNNLQTTLEEEKVNSKKKATFVFTGTIDIVDEKLLKALEAHLRKIAKDTELTILKAEEGSIKITLEASPESLELLNNLFESGELTEVLNLPLEGVKLLSKDLDDEESNKLKIHEIKNTVDIFLPNTISYTYNHSGAIVDANLDKPIGERSVISSAIPISQSITTGAQSISSDINLYGQQRKKLQEALINAFPNIASLEQMLLYGLDKNLRVIVGEGSLQDVVFKLIQTANAQGWLEDLIRAARADNPGNQQLNDIALPNSDPEVPPVSLANNSSKEGKQLRKILILAAIPHGLRLDKEIREIEEAIRRAANQNLFEIRTRTAVHPQDIRRAIAEEEPQIVHFCGHGLENGNILLEDDGGNNKPVTPEGLASLFEIHADYVECVVLNTCYSEKSAVAIRQYINYAIGMNQPIEDKAAIAFAQGFYDGLGYNKISGNQDVFQRAFDEGMVAIKLENISQGQMPSFKRA